MERTKHTQSPCPIARARHPWRLVESPHYPRMLYGVKRFDDFNIGMGKNGRNTLTKRLRLTKRCASHYGVSLPDKASTL